jgi:hypothetical protein
MGSLRDAVKRGLFHRCISDAAVAVDLERVLQVGGGGGVGLLPGDPRPTEACAKRAPCLCSPLGLAYALTGPAAFSNVGRRQVLLQVASSVEYLHGRKLLHCDLKVGV